MLVFILPHEGSAAPLCAFATTVDAVEDATGLDFFSALPNDVELDLEAGKIDVGG